MCLRRLMPCDFVTVLLQYIHQPFYALRDRQALGYFLQKKYGIDYVYANELEIIDGKLTGRYLGDVVDGKRKAELLRLIAQVEGDS